MFKDTLLFENLEQVLTSSSQISCKLLDSIKKVPLEGIHQDSRSIYQRPQLVAWMLVLKFMGIPSVHNCFTGPWARILDVGKDVLYKVKNNPLINWRKILLDQALQSTNGIEQVTSQGQDVSGISCFIIDDSDITKRGKCMEMIGKIFSHVTHQYQLGYKSLNLAFWSGKHLLHLDFSYHAELGKKGNQGMNKKDLSARYSKDRHEDTAGLNRYAELCQKKTKVVKSMLCRAIKNGFEAQYILADSWFFNSDLSTFALSNNLNLISRPKFNNWKYTYQNKDYTIGALIKKLRYSKAVKWNRHLRLRFLSIRVQFKGLDYQLVYFKEKRRGAKWHALITTDKSISAQRAFKIYQTRWAIETSYKELKQILKYGKCQSRDFDAQIADATQCLIAYNLLSHIKAIENYQSIEGLFQECSRQWLKPTMMQRFWNTFYEALKDIAEMLDKSVEEITALVINRSEFLKKLYKLNLYLTTET